jgi:DTW domain-containing protein YfiP
MESNKRSNTGFHVRKLFGDQVKMIMWQRKEEARMKSRCGDNPVLLFPSEYVTSVSEHESRTLVSDLPEHWQSRSFIIIDATWQQARKMYRQSPWLQSLDVWSLPEQAEDVLADFQFTLRKNQVASGCSTVETVAKVMGLLHEQDEARKMLRYFDQFQRDTNNPE